MTGLLLTSLKSWIETLSGNEPLRIKTQTLLDLLACVGEVKTNISTSELHRGQLAELVRTSAPLLVSRAISAGEDLRRRRGVQSEQRPDSESAVGGSSSSGESGSSSTTGSARRGSVDEPLTEPVRLEPEWHQWQRSLRAFSADLELASADDLANVTGAVSSLRTLQEA